MPKKKYIPRASDILGLALILSAILYFLSAWMSSRFGMSELSLFVKLLLYLPIFLAPTFFVYVAYLHFRMPFPVPMRTLGYNESAMLTVSTFGAIILVQVLYSSVFPSVIIDSGVEKTGSLFGFMLLFFSSVVIPAILQELFFRGVVLRALMAYRALLAILISSVVFALMRFSLEEFPLAFFCGFMIGSLYCATGSLMAATSVHISANAVWFLAETVSVYVPARYSLFMRILVASCVLLFAFGLPFLKKTVRAILADEFDDASLPSLQFWGVPIIVFLVLSIAVQFFFGTV